VRQRPESIPPSRAVFTVCTDATERLDRFLADQLAFSRTHAARLIAKGGVVINAETARASRRLSRGDRVEVTIPDADPPRDLVPCARPLSVIYEDEVLLVVDKPAGLVVHPAPGHWDDTLLNALVARGTPLSAGGGRPGIVHRLDKDTSGLLIVSKSDDVHRSLAGALARRKIERTYAALAWGHVSDAIEIDAPVARHPKDRKRMAVLATGRRAVSRVEPVARFDTCDLVRVRLVTGRTHQIRVHLAHIGHPVVGDQVYGHGGARRVTGEQRPRAVAIEKLAPRQVLHAAVLRFTHPVSREELEFRSEWPADLLPALNAAREEDHLLDRAKPLRYLGFFG